MKTILGAGVVLGLVMLVASCGDDSSTGGNGGNGGSGGSSGDIANCGSFCNVAEECGGEDRNACLTECAEEAAIARSISTACFDALSTGNACVGALSCPDALDWLNEIPPDSYPCRDEDIAINNACSN